MLRAVLQNNYVRLRAFLSLSSVSFMNEICCRHTTSAPAKVALRNEVTNTNSSSLPIEDLQVQFTEHYGILEDHGFSNGQIKRLLHPVNDIVNIEPHDLSDNLFYWRQFKQDEKKLLTVLTAYPELVTLNPCYVEHRITELMSVFTQKDIAKLLVTCPKVFLDDFSTIMESINYIVNFMKVQQDSIVKAEALQYNLKHIKQRHIFLARAGKFKLYKRAIINKNAPLNKVLSKNIKTFLKLSGLSEEEYSAFCNSYEETTDSDEMESDSDTEE